MYNMFFYNKKQYSLKRLIFLLNTTQPKNLLNKYTSGIILLECLGLFYMKKINTNIMDVTIINETLSSNLVCFSIHFTLLHMARLLVHLFGNKTQKTCLYNNETIIYIYRTHLLAYFYTQFYILYGYIYTHRQSFGYVNIVMLVKTTSFSRNCRYTLVLTRSADNYILYREYKIFIFKNTKSSFNMFIGERNTGISLLIKITYLTVPIVMSINIGICKKILAFFLRFYLYYSLINISMQLESIRLLLWKCVYIIHNHIDNVQYILTSLRLSNYILKLIYHQIMIVLILLRTRNLVINKKIFITLKILQLYYRKAYILTYY